MCSTLLYPYICQQQTHSLVWVCAAAPPRPSLPSSRQSARNLTCFTHLVRGEQRDQLEPLNTRRPSPSSAPLFSSRCGPPRISSPRCAASGSLQQTSGASHPTHTAMQHGSARSLRSAEPTEIRTKMTPQLPCGASARRLDHTEAW